MDYIWKHKNGKNQSYWKHDTILKWSLIICFYNQRLTVVQNLESDGQVPMRNIFQSNKNLTDTVLIWIAYYLWVKMVEKRPVAKCFSIPIMTKTLFCLVFRCSFPVILLRWSEYKTKSMLFRSRPWPEWWTTNCLVFKCFNYLGDRYWDWDCITQTVVGI